jgi:Antibiotic biosynthesis monooxygenase
MNSFPRRIVPSRTLLGPLALVAGPSFTATTIAAHRTLAGVAESRNLEVVATVKAKPDAEDRLRAEAGKLVAPSRAEPGNISYDLFQRTDDKSVFAFLENWASMEAFTRHTWLMDRPDGSRGWASWPRSPGRDDSRGRPDFPRQ